jgi:hypothetical protein
VLAENLLGSASELPLVTIDFNQALLAAAEAGRCSAGGTEQFLMIGEQLFEALVSGTAVSLEISET